MKLPIVLPAVLLVALALSACVSTGPSAYAGQEARDIKALSAQEVQDLVAGKGMGLAKAAELNGYPGPSHVLELAADLRLSTAQRERTEALFRSMQAKASALGKTLLAAERELDTLFATRRATPETLAAQLDQIGRLQAQLRGAHLEAHLAQVQILEPEQLAQYVKLRGYSGAGSHKH
ncbi:MAG: Spy/CpxP family protein refolding chaperone [Burkholderiaceae bacterium]